MNTMHPAHVLISAVRNEGPFLLEWVAYHRVIGFDLILVYFDNSVDGTQDLAAALGAVDGIICIENSGGGGHRKRAYDDAISRDDVRGAGWVMALDCNEFLNLRIGEGQVDDLTDTFDAADAISVCWRLFGHAGFTEFEDSPILPRFDRAAPATRSFGNRQFGLKTLFRPSGVRSIGPHRPQILDKTPGAFRWVDSDGNDIANRFLEKGWSAEIETASYVNAQINAYTVRSAEAFALHNLAASQTQNSANPLSLKDTLHLNANHVIDRSIARHEKAVSDEVRRLRRKKGVARAHDACVGSFRDLIEEMHGVIGATDDVALRSFLDVQNAADLVRSQSEETTDDPKTQSKQSPLPDPMPEDIAPRWLADLRRSDNRRGWYHSDTTFAGQFTQRSQSTLVVSFDNLSTVKDGSLSRDTWGYGFYADEGWSHLGVMAFERNWYRDDRLFDFMESQTGLFSEFDTVVMTGTSMGGYAATAFANLTPGCVVLAFSPQSTLDQERVPWERRFSSGRKQDWSGRYADAPECCDAASSVFVVYDPYFEPDKLHAERYTGKNVQLLKCWYASHKSAQFMRRADILKSVMLAAVDGSLSSERYYQLFRSRRDLIWYLNGLGDHALSRSDRSLARRLSIHLDKIGRHGLAAGIQRRL